MEIIEKMSDSQYESICDAGIDLMAELASILHRRGLSPEQAFNAIVVAASGVTAAAGLTSNDLAEGVDSIIHMWRVSESPTGREVYFDSSHVRPEATVTLIDAFVN